MGKVDTSPGRFGNPSPWRTEPWFLALCLLCVGSCGALGWALEPEPLQAAPLVAAPCRCLDQPPPPAPKAPTPQLGPPSGAGAAASTALSIVGLVTGAPPLALGLLGQILGLVVSTAAGAARRRKAAP